MKSIKIFSVCLVALLGLSSCASSWLDQELTGGALTQEEYNSMSNVTVGTVKGIYSSFYAVSDHDLFGVKSIDIATDLVSSDLAMTAQAYGWFTTDAQRLTEYRTSYIWSFYFDMIMNANAVLRSLDHKSTLTQEEQDAYAQALAIRAYCYYNLANLYGPAA
ncbi:MAG: RagB/SusD family nutrient uptake outer membrane protein, partial [bacterium]|nr:RagB/SusD family nutrient uptake outer membrane protein [Candidatus Minthenecus merdequi]